ncbi:MAG: BrnT family toxin, partial [Alphaproteobacteria bacterium]|nr:BrnT family toxin [Alphaproteobacteria bacterium]
LAGRMVFVAWTPRDGSRRIISMRKANAREQELYTPRFR